MTLDTAAVSTLLNVSERYVRKLCREGQLEAIRLDPTSVYSCWRITERGLSQYLSRHGRIQRKAIARHTSRPSTDWLERSGAVLPGSYDPDDDVP